MPLSASQERAVEAGWKTREKKIGETVKVREMVRERERGGKEGITELNVCAEKGGRGGQRRRVRGCRRREERGGWRGWKYEVSILLLRISTWLRDGGCAQGEKVEGAEVTAHGGGTLGVQMGWYNGH